MLAAAGARNVAPAPRRGVARTRDARALRLGGREDRGAECRCGTAGGAQAQGGAWLMGRDEGRLALSLEGPLWLAGPDQVPPPLWHCREPQTLPQ